MSSSENDLFATVSDKTSPADVERCLWMHYQIRGQANTLSSERDENFHIKAEDGKQFILKFTHSAEDRSVTDFQTKAMLHVVATDPTLPVARLIATHDGNYFCLARIGNGPERVLRLYSFLEGIPLFQIERTTSLRRNLGISLARLDLALSNFQHHASDHELLWDIKHTAKLKSLLEEMPEGERRDLAEKFMRNFEEFVQPKLSDLRYQVIHNDLNAFNVIVDGSDHDQVTGIVDFGDMVRAPLINELAVACSYQLSRNINPLDTAAEFIAGYHSVLPLRPLEVALLFDLIASRLLMTVVITGWRARRYPENAAYILRNNQNSWDGLERFSKMSREDAKCYLLTTCGIEV